MPGTRAAAGPSGSTLTISTTVGAAIANRRPRAASSGRFWATSPSHARRTRPWASSSPITHVAVSMGTAKLSPWAMAMIAVLIPTTRPAESTSGPPELPGFSATSVWMTFSISRPVRLRSDRPSALTTPADTVDWKPSGLPIATTS